MHASVSRDSRIVAVTYRADDFTELWDPYQRTPIRILKVEGISGKGKPRFSINSGSLFFIGEGIWEGSTANFIQEWDYRSGIPRDMQLLPAISSVKGNSFDISQLSDVIAFGTADGKVYILPIHSCRSVELKLMDAKKSIGTVAFRPDGKILAATSWGGNVIEFWGIPALDGTPTVKKPSEIPAGNPGDCPKIPMKVEHPTPRYDWWGGGKPRI